MANLEYKVIHSWHLVRFWYHYRFWHDSVGLNNMNQLNAVHCMTGFFQGQSQCTSFNFRNAHISLIFYKVIDDEPQMNEQSDWLRLPALCQLSDCSVWFQVCQCIIHCSVQQWQLICVWLGSNDFCHLRISSKRNSSPPTPSAIIGLLLIHSCKSFELFEVESDWMQHLRTWEDSETFKGKSSLRPNHECPLICRRKLLSKPLRATKGVSTSADYFDWYTQKASHHKAPLLFTSKITGSFTKMSQNDGSTIWCIIASIIFWFCRGTHRYNGPLTFPLW